MAVLTMCRFRSLDIKGTKRPGTMTLAAPGGRLEVIRGLRTAVTTALPTVH